MEPSERQRHEQAERVLMHYRQMANNGLFTLHLHNLRLTPAVLQFLQDEILDLGLGLQPTMLSFAYSECSPNAQEALLEFCQELMELEEVTVAGDGQGEASIDDYYFVLTSLQACNHIHTLELHNISDLCGETTGQLLGEIAFLKCAGCTLDVDFVRGFASNSLRSSPPQSLVFCKCQLTDEMLSVLAFDNVWRDNCLEELDLTDNQFTAQSLPALTALLQQNFESLTTLTLGDNSELFLCSSISAELHAFLNCLSNSSVVDLKLFGCDLNNLVAGALFKALEQNTTLEKLDLYGSKSTFDVSGWEQSLPKLKVLRNLLLPWSLCKNDQDWHALGVALTQNTSLTTIQLFSQPSPEWNKMVSHVTSRNKGMMKALELISARPNDDPMQDNIGPLSQTPVGLWPFFMAHLLRTSTAEPNASAAYIFYRGTQTLLHR